jgi:hypothetical protein
MKLSLTVLLTFGTLSCTSVVPHQPQRLIPTSVCSLATESASFHEKRVVVSGEVTSDIVEHTMIVSDQCPAEAVVLVLSKDDPNGGEALKQAIVDAMPNKLLTATLEGTFEWRPDDYPTRILRISGASNIRVSPRN